MLKKFIIVSLLVGAAFGANEDEAPKEDHLAIATMMFYDGKYDKARGELKLVAKSDPNFDREKYYTTAAMVELRSSNYARAIELFHKAIKATKNKTFLPPPEVKEKQKYLFKVFTKEEPKKVVKTVPFDAKKVKQDKLDSLYIYLSQAYYRNKNYAGTISALDSAGKKGVESASLFTLRAECYWKLENHEGALNTLSRGLNHFPNDETLLKQRFYYFAELKLYQAAIDAAKRYIAVAKGSKANEYITLAQMLIGANQKDQALTVLEEAKVKYPNEAKISMLLGHLYLKRGMPHTTAHLFEEASHYDSKFKKEASEMYRRAKDLPHALYLNSQISDEVEKLKQKVAIYIARGEFEFIIGLRDALDRYAMLDDDNIAYALAYSYYMIKDYDAAEELFKQINDSELFSKATLIRKNIEKCKNSSLECI
ncbi:MAG: hypothetical protein JXQ76_02135 [Campylobacterales bacterium]|nr:hypothetical protein [Campylobacterales bacterium]